MKDKNKKYKVQRNYLYGWDDAFFDEEIDENGDAQQSVTLFKTEAEAEADITDHIEDIEYAISKGYMGKDSYEPREHFRIIENK